MMLLSRCLGPHALPFSKHGLCPFRAPILKIFLHCSCNSLFVQPPWYFLLLLPSLSMPEIFLRHKSNETCFHFYIHSAFIRIFSGPSRISVYFHDISLSPHADNGNSSTGSPAVLNLRFAKFPVCLSWCLAWLTCSTTKMENIWSSETSDSLRTTWL